MKKTVFTRSKVIENTVKEFRKRGCQKTTIKDIAERSKVTEAEVYSHFANKRELTQEALKIVSQNFDCYIQDSLIVADPQNSFQALTYLGEAILVWSVKEPNLAKLLTRQFKDNQEETGTRHLFTRLIAFNEVLIDFMNDFQLRIEKNQLALQFWAFIQGYAGMIRNSDCRYERKTIQSFVSILTGQQEKSHPASVRN